MVEKLSSKIRFLIFNKKLYHRFRIFFFSKSYLLQKLINILMLGGKKIKSEKIVIAYLRNFKNLIGYNTIMSFFNVLETLKFSLELIPKRIGKKIFQIPIPVRPYRQYLRSIRWFKLLLKKKQNKKFVNILISEHLNILNDKNKSIILKKKQQMYSLAFENRMFTHFRWY